MRNVWSIQTVDKVAIILMATFLFEYLWPGSPGHLFREGSASAGGLFSEPGIPGVNTMKNGVKSSISACFMI